MKIWMVCAVLMLLLVITAADACTDKLSEMALQNAINQQNFFSYVDMKFNQTDNKQQQNYFALQMLLINRTAQIDQHTQETIRTETDPIKFNMGSMLESIAFAGTLMALRAFFGS